jgi:putative transcriptional regulator
MMQMSKILGNRINVYRAEHRMSQADLAEAIGVSRKTISTIEVGRFIPSTIIALQIARHFDAKFEDLFWLKELEETDKD